MAHKYGDKAQELNIVVVATDTYLNELFTQYLLPFENVSVHLGRFENLTGYDCVASPANSFGLMDGGMDAALTHYFGGQLQQRVQEHIIAEYFGEQPVGTSFILETHNSVIPYLAHSPTMRVPADIRGTENVYLATKATLVEAVKHPNVTSIILPAFGAGCGMVHRQEVARQMALAVKHVMNPLNAINWEIARFRDYEIKGR